MIDGKNILLIDENEEFLLAMTLMLVSKGYGVSTANTMKEALSVCRTNNVNLAIIGSNIRRTDEQRLADELNKLLPTGRILHISHFLPHEIERKRIQKDGEKYIAKNYNLDRFFDQVETALNQEGG